MSGRLLAISDLHVGYDENRALVEQMRPTHDDDWLIVAGDVADWFADVTWALRTLAGRFAKVIWAPGNHELWTPAKDPEQARGMARYELLVEACRSMGVLTPEDPYAMWQDRVAIAPMLVLYDYSFWPKGAASTEQALAMAHAAGVVGTDEVLLHSDPYPGRAEWCHARVEATERRLSAVGGPTVLVNHFPLVREPTDILWYPEFALWCGTTRTAGWPVRYRAEAVVYGHLHIPRTTWHDGIRHEEVSVGYPREWRKRSEPPGRLRPVFPGA
ncbi:MAG TPA: metallophosphoesterase [Dactylosporangium sp.]|nr:metallophosphoesterase [Dactylosporangium sp.]